MEHSDQHPAQSSKDAGPVDESHRAGPKELHRRIALCLLDLEKELIYKDGVHLTQFRMTKRGDDWLLMLKGRKGPNEKVAFVSGDSYVSTLIEGVTSSDCGYLNWREDNPPWRR